MDDTVRIATIGTSGICAKFIATTRGVDGIDCVGCCSRSIDHAREFAARNGVGTPDEPLVFEDVDAVAASPNVDAVYVATPTAPHAEEALKLVSAGKHVLVEKTFAPNPTKARAIFDAADASGVIAMEAMRSLYVHGFDVMEQAVAHDIGHVRLASIHFGKVSSRIASLREGTRSNTFDPHLSAGGIMDLGVYTVEPTIALFGRPLSVHAAGYATPCPWLSEDDPYAKTDLAAHALLDYGDMAATLSYSRITDDMLCSQIQGDGGTLLVDSVSTPCHITLHVHESSDSLYATTSGTNRTLLDETPDETLLDELVAFRDAVRGVPETAAKVRRFRQVTIDSLDVMTEIRHQLGVFFPADADE